MTNDPWATPAQMNTILGNKPGSSGFRTLLGRFPFLRDEPYSRPGGRDIEFNIEAVLAWHEKRPGSGNRTPGFKGTSKANSNV